MSSSHSYFRLRVDPARDLPKNVEGEDDRFIICSFDGYVFRHEPSESRVVTLTVLRIGQMYFEPGLTIVPSMPQ